MADQQEAENADVSDDLPADLLYDDQPDETIYFDEEAIRKGGASLIVRALESDPLPRSFVTPESKAISKLSRLRAVAQERAPRIKAAPAANQLTAKLAGYIGAAFNNAQSAA
jgi:hypothetical protein